MCGFFFTYSYQNNIFFCVYLHKAADKRLFNINQSFVLWLVLRFVFVFVLIESLSSSIPSCQMWLWVSKHRHNFVKRDFFVVVVVTIHFIFIRIVWFVCYWPSTSRIISRMFDCKWRSIDWTLNISSLIFNSFKCSSLEKVSLLPTNFHV